MIGSIEATGHVLSPNRTAAVDAPPPPTPAPPQAAGPEPIATYMPVRINYETDAEVLVMKYQNATTGEVRKQIPDPGMLETYRSRAALGLPPYDAPPTEADAASLGRTHGTAAAPEGDSLPPVGIGGAGGPATDGAAAMGSGTGGLAAPERPVGGSAANAVRTVA